MGNLNDLVSKRISQANYQVVVGIPIYNAPHFLKDLLDDMEFFLSEEKDVLFIFSDDASPDPTIKKILAEHAFCKRENSVVYSAAANQGFLLNMNSVFAARPKHADLIILNTDVRLYSNFVRELREVAKKQLSVGSIMPLSTNATLGSLVNWPEGGSLGHEQVKSIANYLANLDAAITHLDIPTSVGFCMYMTAEALNNVGDFDPAFKRGYGEESDWCRRAVKQGFRHILSLRTVVAHIGTQSFTSDQKIKALENAEKILTKKHPEYFAHVLEHLAENQLRFFRLNLFVSALENKGVVIQFLHADPEDSKAGGTELHVRYLNAKYFAEGLAVLELFPKTIDTFGIRFFDGKGTDTVETFFYDDFQKLLLLLEPKLTFMHIHHLLRWSNDVVDWMIADTRIKKVFTFHDFWMVCPTVNLLRYHTTFCHVEPDVAKCGDCYRKNADFMGRDAHVHRKRMQPLLEKCIQVIAPSISAKEVILKGFPTLQSKIQVIPHDLGYIRKNANFDEAPSETRKQKIAFVGGLGVHKGCALLADALPELEKNSIEVIVIGSVDVGFLKRFKKVKIIPYKSVEGLKAALESEQPTHVGFISAWPETFCYTLFESLLVGNGAIPVVGPYGNPRTFIETTSVGTVMKNYDVPSLVQAILQATESRETYLKRLSDWKKSDQIWTENIDALFVDPVVRRFVKRTPVLTDPLLYEPLFKSNRNHAYIRRLAGREFENVAYRFALAFKKGLRNIPFLGKTLRSSYAGLKWILKGGKNLR
jgi:GT2 family glycosyltransferase